MEGSIGRPETKYGRGGKEEMDGVRAQRNAASSNERKTQLSWLVHFASCPSNLENGADRPPARIQLFFIRGRVGRRRRRPGEGGNIARNIFCTS